MRYILLLFLSLIITNNTFAEDYTTHLNNGGFFRCVPKLTLSPVEVINFETGSREQIGVGDMSPKYPYFGSNLDKVKDELTFDLKVSSHGITFLKPSHSSHIFNQIFEGKAPTFIFIEPNRWFDISSSAPLNSFAFLGPLEEEQKENIKKPYRDAFGNKNPSIFEHYEFHAPMLIETFRHGKLSLYRGGNNFTGLISITTEEMLFNKFQKGWFYSFFPFEKLIAQCKPLNTDPFIVPITDAEINGVVMDPNGAPSIDEAQRCLSIFAEARDHFEEKRYLDKFMFAQDGRDNLRAWLKARNVDTNVRKYYEASENLRDLDETEFERYFSLCYEKYKMERLDYYTNNGILSP